MSSLTLGHGSGGRLTQDLIGRITAPFPRPETPELEDCALLPEGPAVTIDGFTVDPRVFPGGDIGKLAICGSANDLAVRGVKPLYICLSVIAEEGLEEEELAGYMQSASKVCSELGVRLVSGDTKVVPRGCVDGLFLTTCAVGMPVPTEPLGMDRLKPGDKILVTRSIGNHGATIAACRFDLSAQGLETDCASLWGLLEPLLELKGLRCMRDSTRGGMGTVLCEWAEGTNLGIEIDEAAVPIQEGVRSVSDLLGFDPLYLACEGTAVIGVAPDEAQKALELLRSHPLGREAEIIGTVTEEHPELVGMKTLAGGMRIVDMPVGEILPRIC